MCRAYLATPAHSHNAPLLDLASGLGLNVFDHAGNDSDGLWGSTLVLEEGAQLGALLGGVGWEVGEGVGLAFEKVGNVDLVAGVGEQVGTLWSKVSVWDRRARRS